MPTPQNKAEYEAKQAEIVGDLDDLISSCEEHDRAEVGKILTIVRDVIQLDCGSDTDALYLAMCECTGKTPEE